MWMCIQCIVTLCLLAGAYVVESTETQFACRTSEDVFVPGSDTKSDAEERECCLTLPCEYNVGCWVDGAMPPMFSAPRFQAITPNQAHHLASTLILPATKSVNKTFVAEMPEHGWYRIPVPQDTHSYFYDGIRSAFRHLFDAEVIVTVDLDVFFVDDFDEHWASDETYRSAEPGAAYWIHTDCENLRLCHGESGFATEDFTGNGLAFVYPVALPSEQDFREGHDMMPAALELYNVTQGFATKPPHRGWAEVHRYNLGELIFFNAFRYHSGHVPRQGTVSPADNPLRRRGEAVGFGAELHDGRWVLFRMCKGSTNDALLKKILATDRNDATKMDRSSRECARAVEAQI